MLQKTNTDKDIDVPEKYRSSQSHPSLDLLQKLALRFIRLYQLILSPWIGRQCRFYPSCSHYGAEAITVHGFWHGMKLTLARIGRCHPFHPGGVDLVPPDNSQAPR